jgi:inhibitor of cysteine peptidase
VLLSAQDDNTTVQAGVGDAIEVALSENPSTGYRWEVADADGQILTVEDNRFSVTQGAIGGAGSRRVTFRARRAGTARISLMLRRHWEPANAAIARWAVTVEVHDG